MTKQITENKQPYSQGKLDCLCGIYSLINAHLKLKYFPFSKAQYLFQNSICWIHSKYDLSCAMSYGLTVNQLLSINKHVFQPYFSSKISRPFMTKKEFDLQVHDWICKFASLSKRAIIICYSTNTYSHWSVVNGATDKRFYLYDSYHINYISKPNITKSIKIRPSNIIYLYLP